MNNSIRSTEGGIITKKHWQEMDTNYKNLVLVKQAFLFGRRELKNDPKVGKSS